MNGGYTTYTCSVCGDSYIADEIPALGHDYTSEVTKAPTCTEDGVMTYTCGNCGDTYTEVIPATGHMLGDVNCDGEITTLDAVLLAQYLTGWDVTLELSVADLNGDGEITTLDATLLSQILTD